MPRGLGREQRALLRAIASNPDKPWQRIELQQAAWGAHPQGSPGQWKVVLGPHRLVKNVNWWRDEYDHNGDPLLNYEGNFTRALSSLVRRGLLERRQTPEGHVTWTLTPAGLAEAQKLTLN